ncbi:hypothetical protein GCM10010112_41220 [Actinoplanes lobatus]|uniref:Signal transduction histidine kinase n=1 Tax=Actinoplanes lobatus TaxID=113568 RepID=A0A7W7HNG0_9ACTN|nr:hypothetical protein [Actinoplanes lobatus]MBB4753763.1 signal transduction histidine kinase [Actinoplanes lobatus]GGN72630.1 hypothetical protein GCM10010112_41220 [Actinoplanes lobatus]GIE42084.1 hypothetical protein Alo02nite_49820 [Actinoplanes lobatus]
MSVTPMPRYVDQTRALLWIQLMLNMVGILLFVALIVVLQPPLESDDGLFAYLALGGLFFGGLLSATAAKMFARGWAFSWVLALFAQALVLVAVWSLWQMGLVIGVPLLIVLAGTGWIGVNLFRGQVLRHFFTPSRA